MKEFGTNRLIGNKRVVTLRYTDLELSSRIVRYLHIKGYRITEDFTVVEYKGVKNRPTSRIEAIIMADDLFQIMAIKQRRVAEIAMNKVAQLTLTFYH